MQQAMKLSLLAFVGPRHGPRLLPTTGTVLQLGNGSAR